MKRWRRRSTRNDLKKYAKAYAQWLLNAPHGAVLNTPFGMLIKDFWLEDVGFTRIGEKYYRYDPVLGIGKRISKEYILEIIADAIISHPEIFFES